MYTGFGVYNYAFSKDMNFVAMKAWKNGNDKFCDFN